MTKYQRPEDGHVSPQINRSTEKADLVLLQEPAASSSDDVVINGKPQSAVPLSWKLTSILLVSLIGFGSNWSSGITGAMKSTLKKELDINNTQYSLLTSSEDFMTTLLILVTGILTDRIGGAGAILYGNMIYSVGSILVAGAAQVRSFKFMIAGRVILALGDIATKVAQYKIFSSWFPPNNGFASTLGLELAIGKIGAFVGKSSANVIAKNTGNFAWVFWVAVFMNLFTNCMTAIFYWFNRVAHRKFSAMSDPATGEHLTEKNKRFEFQKIGQLPWVFWCIVAFSAFQTSTASVFQQNATELAEQRFNTDSITAGWYSATLQYAGFFVVPCVGLFVDALGNRISLMAFIGAGSFISMALVAWASTTKGTAAAFGIYAFVYSFGPTVIIDSIRTSMWHQEVFGSAYAIKLNINNAMNIIINIVTGVIQDHDNDSYNHVTIVYAVDALAAMLVAFLLVFLSWKSIDIRNLQWTRRQRIANGALWNERKEMFHKENGPRNRMISKYCLVALAFLVVGSWVAYIWGAVTGNSE